MSNSIDVDIAVLNRIASDATLKTIMPDGTWWKVSASGKTRVVLLDLLHHEVTEMQGAIAYEQMLYLVKAVEYSQSGLNVINAAKRIQALLLDAVFPITGYTVMRIQLSELVHYAEPDSANPDQRWQHCGAVYRVSVSPN